MTNRQPYYSMPRDFDANTDTLFDLNDEDHFVVEDSSGTLHYFYPIGYARTTS